MTITENSGLPSSAEAILNQYINAIGGRTAIESINTRIITTTTRIANKNQTIETTLFIKKPDKAYVVVEFKLMGKKIKSEGGRNADIAWQITPGLLRSDYKIFTGKEKKLKFADLTFDTAAVAWQNDFKSIHLEGEEKIDGQPCYKLIFTPYDQAYMDTICCFEKKTALLQKIIREVHLQKHAGIAQIYLSDYTPVDSILLPHTFTCFFKGTQKMTITIDRIELNVDIPDSQFELPQKIKTLALRI